jgi:hypothetical protein
MRSLWFLVAALTLLAPAASVSIAQAPPKPGPEMDILKSMEGTWDATIKIMGQESKGKMTYKMELGGLWLASSIDSELFGAKFEGRGMDSYDANKKKYVGVWFDSMTTVPMISEGTYDAATKKMTMESMMPDQTGKVVKNIMVTEYKDADNVTFTLSGPGANGKMEVMISIDYKRKK